MKLRLLMSGLRLKGRTGLFILVLGLTAVVSPEMLAKNPQHSQEAAPRKDIPSIAKSATGGIVTIVMGNDDKPLARGTGFLASQDGVIVTNYHVIANGNIGIVKFSDGTALTVDGVLAADKVRDLAIIRIHSSKTFHALSLGNSDRVQVGEEVVAIGNPLGLELTVSNGILSGVRTVEKEGKFLQITAPISHGSSGGPLFNMAGEVIGITSMFFEGGENLNFAIPVNDAKHLLQNRSAKLQSLPNEPFLDAVTPSNAKGEPPNQTFEQQACDRQAAKFFHYNQSKRANDNEFISHFQSLTMPSLETNQCFVEIGSYELVHQETFYEGGRLIPKEVSPYPVWVIKIYDASSEGDLSNARIYGYLYYRKNDKNDKKECHVYPTGAYGSYTGSGGIECRSKEEFDDLVLEHFGLSHLTRIVPTEE